MVLGDEIQNKDSYTKSREAFSRQERASSSETVGQESSLMLEAQQGIQVGCRVVPNEEELGTSWGGKYQRAH